jgi:hypothetical protein
VGDSVQLSAIAARCGDPAGVSVTASVNGVPMALTAQGNGLYTATYAVTAGGPLLFALSATSPGGSDSATVSGQVPTPIVPGGAPVTVSVVTPGETALLGLSGTAGRRVSLKLSGVTMGSSSVRLLEPDGSSVATTYVGGSGGFMDVRTLAATGPYTLVVDPSGTATGSMTLTLYDVPPDADATAVPGGPPVTVATTVPGQGAGVSFEGVAGRRVSVLLAGVTMSSSSVRLAAPDGSWVGSATYLGTSGGFVDVRMLPATGTYTVVVDPQGTATGSMTLTLYDVPPDAEATAVPGGPPAMVATLAPGQNCGVHFDGVADGRVSVGLSGVTMSSAAVRLLAPDGRSLSTTYVGSSGGFVDVQTLPATGTYTVAVDPQGTATGSMTVTVYDVPPDVTASIVRGGPMVTVTTTAPGQNAAALFDGAAGQSLTLKVGGVTMSSSMVSVLAPDGSYVVRRTYVFTSGRTFTFVLPSAGPYTIGVDPQAASVGSMTLKLS